MLPKEAYLEYQKIYKDENGVELPMEQAIQEANALLGLCAVLSKPKHHIDPTSERTNNENS